ncbi:hypothetical protein DFJ74DRAFT_650522 [Hyaloraphidium curvatum]|nr:hypothetical protein DFJ74DRAFT_698298 [Hyaloraphidium curvatum]KAI9033051.1 hypothetical protein DFJ74DRAFT_650522 [Hyaloraphidium curvatum]
MVRGGGEDEVPAGVEQPGGGKGEGGFEEGVVGVGPGDPVEPARGQDGAQGTQFNAPAGCVDGVQPFHRRGGRGRGRLEGGRVGAELGGEGRRRRVKQRVVVAGRVALLERARDCGQRRQRRSDKGRDDCDAWVPRRRGGRLPIVPPPVREQRHQHNRRHEAHPGPRQWDAHPNSTRRPSRNPLKSPGCRHAPRLPARRGPRRGRPVCCGPAVVAGRHHAAGIRASGPRAVPSPRRPPSRRGRMPSAARSLHFGARLRSGPRDRT